MKRLFFAILLLGWAALTGTVGAEEIRSGAGMCLDVHSPCQSENGCRVQIWECNGSRQQTWTMQ